MDQGEKLMERPKKGEEEKRKRRKKEKKKPPNFFFRPTPHLGDFDGALDLGGENIVFPGSAG